MKCPNCGAPMQGNVCAYCGADHTPPPQPQPQAAVPAREAGRGKRNLLDIILIVLGGLWCLGSLSAALELSFTSPVEWAAALLLASPGIVLLLIGFRRKKPKKK